MYVLDFSSVLCFCRACLSGGTCRSVSAKAGQRLPCKDQSAPSATMLRHSGGKHGIVGSSRIILSARTLAGKEGRHGPEGAS